MEEGGASEASGARPVDRAGMEGRKRGRPVCGDTCPRKKRTASTKETRSSKKRTASKAWLLVDQFLAEGGASEASGARPVDVEGRASEASGPHSADMVLSTF